jgi:CBS domain-containing protein
MKVRDLMTRHPICCSPDDSLETAARRMADGDCGAIPVIDEVERFPIGIITDRDIVVRAVATAGTTDLRVRDCMTAPAVTVTEDMDLNDCVSLLEQAQLRRLIVVDRDGRCSGIVAQADIASHASKRKTGELLRYVSQPSAAVEPAFARL